MKWGSDHEWGMHKDLESVVVVIWKYYVFGFCCRRILH